MAKVFAGLVAVLLGAFGSGSSALAGTDWYGTFYNLTSVPVSVSGNSPSCWYAMDLGGTTVLQPTTSNGQGQTIHSQVDGAVWPIWNSCSGLDITHSINVVVTSSAGTVSGNLSVTAPNFTWYCTITMGGYTTPQTECSATDSALYYTVTIQTDVSGSLVVTPTITNAGALATPGRHRD